MVAAKDVATTHVHHRQIPVSRHSATRVDFCVGNKIRLSSPSYEEYFYIDKLSTFDLRLLTICTSKAQVKEVRLG